MKKILLINPPRVGGKPVVREERFEHRDFEVIYPPLTLLYCAAQIRKHLGAKVKLYFLDAMGYNLSLEQVKNRFKEIDPDIVITRFAFDTYREDLDLLSELKKIKSDVITITRNKIVSDVPALMEKYLRKFRGIDYFVTVEQDSVIHKVVKKIIGKKIPNSCAFIRGNKLKITPREKEIEDLDEIAFPAYDLLPKNPWPYKSSLFPKDFTLILSSRGCPNQCSFCAYRNMKWRFRSPEDVFEEIKMLYDKYHIRNFVYFDDTISINKERCLKICKLLRKSKMQLKYAICTRVNNVDEGLLLAWKKTGLEEISFGVESGSEKILKMCGKNINKKQIRVAFGLCKKLKIKSLTLVILGLPGETKETIAETKSLVNEINPFYLQYSLCIPFPNTPAYHYYKSKGFLLHEDYSKYNPLTLEPVIRTEDLTPVELIKEKERAYREFILRPKFVLSKISLTDWRWNIRGFVMFTKRLYGLFKGYIR